MQIELHPEVAKNLLNYLLNAKKRAEFVIAKKEKYPQGAIQRAEHVVSLLTPVCDSLNKAIQGVESLKAKPEEQPKQTDLEKRLRDLELKTAQMEVIVKKLVAYHEGEIK